MKNKTLDQQITKMSQKYPEKIAIKQGNKEVTYLQFERKSNKLANFLHNRVKKNKNVLILLDKSPELIEAIIGVLKCGLIFVPVTPILPENRIQLFLKETKSEWLITSKEYYQKFKGIIANNGSNLNILPIDMVEKDYDHEECRNTFYIDAGIEDQRLIFRKPSNEYCYIYFTSGSTGAPKGVLGKHRSLIHFIEWEIKEFGVDERFNVSQLTVPSFDPFLRDIFVPLTVGGTCCIPEDNYILMNPDQLAKWIHQNHITLMHIVPSLFKLLFEEINDPGCFISLKFVLIAGELLRGNDISKFIKLFNRRIQLVNLYGPTETTLAKLFYKIREEDADKAIIPIGQPIEGAEALILDNDMQKCLIGNVGEIYIRTPFSSAGYFNDQTLNKQVFIKNPHSNDPQDIIYKTGDLGRRLPDGNIEIVGRVDDQAKIRGMRVETKEIENILLYHRDIKEVVVTVKKDERENNYLIAYFVPAVPNSAVKKELTASTLRTYLSKELPDYMIPAYFVSIDKVPLTTNGKVDKNSLMELAEGISIEVTYEAPANEIEKTLVNIWKEILGIDKIGRNNDFFDLGGHSLKVTLLASRIHKTLNVKIPFRDIFNRPTIKALSEHIQSIGKNIYSSIKPAKRKDYYALSSSQKRMYILQQGNLASTSYNITTAFLLEGNLDRKKMEWVFKRLIKRHENFRTSFEMIDNAVVQKIHDDVDFEVVYYEMEEGEAHTFVQQRFVRPFDLSKAPLLRVGLIRIAQNRHILMADMNHIITDGISSNILVKEFIMLYKGRALPSLRLQYKDYAEWQNSEEWKKALKAQEEFWLNLFSKKVRPLDIPTDYPRKSFIHEFEGDAVHFELDETATKKLKEMILEKEVTLYIILLSVYYVLLSKYSGREDITIGSPVSCRTHADLENIIGMFVNTLAMRNYPKGEKTFSGFLEEVKENSLKAFNNQDYPFDELIHKLNLDKGLNRNQLFDVTFDLKNMENHEIEIEGLKLKPYPFEIKTTKFEQVLLAIETENKIYFILSYSTKVYKRETMEQLCKHYQDILKTVLKNGRIKLIDIELILDYKEVIEKKDNFQLERIIDFNF
jgi:amino acid adenylation domain-containing protein